MEDLVLLDSIMRTPNATTDEFAALSAPVSCAVDVDRAMNLSGLRLGLPSNFGWVNPGLSGEVSTELKHGHSRVSFGFHTNTKHLAFSVVCSLCTVDQDAALEAGAAVS